MRSESFYEKCESCGSRKFYIKVVPFGICGTDSLFICADCGTCIGGVINDPEDEWSEDVPVEDIGAEKFLEEIKELHANSLEE